MKQNSKTPMLIRRIILLLLDSLSIFVSFYASFMIFYIIGIWFRLVDKRLKQILTISKIKSNAPALLYFSACKNVTRYIIS